MNEAQERTPDRLPVIGLTGGIGAGKSTVAGLLSAMGCVVSDSDRDAAVVMDSREVIDRLCEWWGEEIVAVDGALDRKAIARKVFADEAARQRLESLVHPLIHDRRRRRFEEAGPTTPALVIDAPLLFEAGVDGECDVVVFVDAPRDVRLHRVARDRDWDERELDRREAAQLPIAEKRSRSTVVITNDSDRDRLATEVRAVLDSIVDA